MTEEEAYMVCSISVDLMISEIADAPNKLVPVFLPEATFKYVSNQEMNRKK